MGVAVAVAIILMAPLLVKFLQSWINFLGL
jgi:hypothetical protein